VGEHTREVLAEFLRYPATQIDALVRERVIEAPER
jgi:crotonobetainyl-CoA:carnitine CoA-transferase CaiB-like acyl-CoA transferase